MNFIFDPVFIKENELLFYIYLIVIALMIILTAIFVVKEIKNDAK